MAAIHQMLLGAAGGFVFVQSITATTYDYILKDAALAAGWDGASPLTAIITVETGVFVGATTTAGAAFRTGAIAVAGSKLTLINKGYIIGRGGDGGNGQYYTNTDGRYGLPGLPGGPALQASFPLTVDNQNSILGGGGGGSSGRQAVSQVQQGYDTYYAFGGTGGGGAGQGGGTGGGGGSWANGGIPGQSGGSGSLGGSAGQGGTPGSQTNGPASSTGGFGGNGGAYGQDGSTGGDSNPSSLVPAAAGGAAGAAVVGNSNITWVSTGTRLGAIT